MKKLITLIIILSLIICTLGACGTPIKMLPELRCNKCNGEYKYDHTFNFLGETEYCYICQTCGKEFRTEIWRGK